MIKSVLRTILNPGQLARRQGEGVRRAYSVIAKIGHPFTYLSRRSQKADTSEMSERGYAVFQPGEIEPELVQAALAEVKDRLSKVDIEAVRAQSKKPYLVALIKGDQIDRSSAIYKFVTSDSIVDRARKYLGFTPILSYLAVWYSPNDTQQREGSQLFHLDHADFRQVKAFLFIDDVDENSGPFTFFDAVASDKVTCAVKYRMTEEEKRVEDDAVARVLPTEQPIPLVGPSGTFALVDTCRCLHFGSRNGKRPRVLLTFQYITPFAFILPWFWRRSRLLPRHLWSKELPAREAQLLGQTI